jgi:serine/threonine protein kinase
MLSFQQEISLMEFFADSIGVAKFIGYCTSPACLLMKYYPHGSLDTWMTHKRIDKRSFAVILRDVSRTIHVLHSRQVAHCDLKPQNILVEKIENGFNFLLTDFGISKILTAEYLASEAFQIRNLRGLTIPFASPDILIRFRSKNAVSSPIEEKAGDIYSFGALIYNVMVQRQPWSE